MLLVQRGNYEAAIETLRESVDAFAGAPPTNAEARRARLDLANVLRLNGSNEEAIDVLDATLLWQQVLPSGHPDPLRTRLRRAALYRRIGRPEESLAESRRVLEDYQRIYGRTSVPAATAHRAVGATLFALERVTEALEHMELDLTIIRDRLGPDHRETLRAAHNLAYALAATGRPEDELRAAAIYADCIERGDRAFGTGHPTMAAFRASQAGLLLRLGRLDEAAASLLAPDMEVALAASSEGVRSRVTAILSEILDRSDCRFPSNRGMGLERERLTEELPLIRSAACVPRNGAAPAVARNSD
jgi:tetratricopeptide (TPR) repeat protein